MINHNDQLDLFRLISEYIKHDIECYAFGGTAMMFYGYKDQTKDIDLLFKDDATRTVFIEAIIRLGYIESSAIGIYAAKKLVDKSKPLMYKRGDSRLDLFAGKIFRTQLSPKMEADLFAVHDFKGSSNLRVKVMRKEHLVLLKSVTERDKDFGDIMKIVETERAFDWQYLVEEAIWQHERGDSWILLDLEKTLQELKRYVLIEEKYFDQLYEAQK